MRGLNGPGSWETRRSEQAEETPPGLRPRWHLGWTLTRQSSPAGFSAAMQPCALLWPRAEPLGGARGRGLGRRCGGWVWRTGVVT